MAFILADVGPCVLDVGDRPRVDRVGVGEGQLEDHFASKRFAVQHLGFDFFEDFLSQFRDLFDKFRPKLFVIHRLQRL